MNGERAFLVHVQKVIARIQSEWGKELRLTCQRHSCCNSTRRTVRKTLTVSTNLEYNSASEPIMSWTRFFRRRY
jgi:hypothetical protein